MTGAALRKPEKAGFSPKCGVQHRKKAVFERRPRIYWLSGQGVKRGNAENCTVRPVRSAADCGSQRTG